MYEIMLFLLLPLLRIILYNIYNFFSHSRVASPAVTVLEYWGEMRGDCRVLSRYKTEKSSLLFFFSKTTWIPTVFVEVHSFTELFSPAFDTQNFIQKVVMPSVAIANA